jgi:signal transduction histidine kinase
MHFPALSDGNLQRRFVFRVLLPPFLALLVLSLLVFWQLDKQIRRQAIGELSRAAGTVATKLDREFALREVVLRRTGEELFVIKSEYQADKKKLDESRDGCRNYIRQKATYNGAPAGVCDPFIEALVAGGPKLQVLEDQYEKNGQALNTNQNQRINERLAALKQFFPESLALIIVDKNGQVVSSALSGAFKGSTEPFQADAKTAVTAPIRGKIISVEGFELSLFAFPISGGAVLAAYDVNNPAFIKQTWDSAPINKSTATAVILDSNGDLVYPDLKKGNPFKSSNEALRTKPYQNIELRGAKYIAVGEEVGESRWLVVVASPKAAVLGPLRNAQLAGVIVLGLLIVGFLWIGTYFIQRIVRNIVRLVKGANIFGAGKLDHKIVLDGGDKELNQLAETLNNMAQRIDNNEKAMDQKNKEFISIATHELRAPLSSIIGYLSMFKEKYDQKLSQDGKQMIDEVYYSTSRLRDLVNDMLNVARLEGAHNDTQLAPYTIDKLASDIIKSMEVVARKANVTLTYNNAHATNVLADEGRLRIIFNNLISNAIKYNRPGGSVSVSYSEKDGQLIVSVADTGLGIPEEQKTKMFEKFFRVSHQDRKNITGTGLGMYITKRYVEDMGGKIWFTSTHGKGTTFHFSLLISKELMN